MFRYYTKSLLLLNPLIKLSYELLYQSFPGTYIRLGWRHTDRMTIKGAPAYLSPLENGFFQVWYLQERVPLGQQVLDLLGHGVKHQLQVQAFRLHQLLPLERQHRARVLSHLRGQFTRFLKGTEGQRGQISGETVATAWKACKRAGERHLCLKVPTASAIMVMLAGQICPRVKDIRAVSRGCT